VVEMKKRIFLSILTASASILVLTSMFIVLALFKDYEKERKQEIASECMYLAEAFDVNNFEYLETVGRKSVNRITLIAADGTVLYDSFENAASLDNHLDRPEIAAARANGSGESTRRSETRGENMYYYALRLDNGYVLRIAASTKSMLGLVNNTAGVIAAILLLAVALAALISNLLTKAIVAPLNRLNLDEPLSNNTYGELTPLLVRMNKQKIKIDEQLEEIETKQAQIQTIAGSMPQALVIFGANKHVLYANASAETLFPGARAGIGYLELCRDTGYKQAVEAAFGGYPADVKIENGAKTYRLSVNPVQGDKTYAAVLFAADITQEGRNEKIRREFSANVSHELKTPLTSIMGYAEIMHNSIAKQEDYPRLAGQIYGESKRLLALIEDIIKLSQLDEGEIQGEFAPVNLLALARKVADTCLKKAQVNAVALTVNGEKCVISGIEGTLFEMVYNLCDNALTYNKPGGSVEISVAKDGSHAVLSVKDTGIGIAPEHLDRVFERFYRVDKSRSKETGGTGLGLSIVKHGALLHHAEIGLESRPGEGTTVTLVFGSALL